MVPGSLSTKAHGSDLSELRAVLASTERGSQVKALVLALSVNVKHKLIH